MAAGVFFVYLHCKPDGTPFYVGKGRYGRAMGLIGRNHFYRNVVSKYGVSEILKFAFECDSEEQAFEDEKRHIADLRSQGYQLTNLTDGGEGVSGHKHSEEARARISRAGVGNTHTLGKKLTKEHIERIVAVNTGKQYCLGRRLSDEHKDAIRAANMGNKHSLGHRHSDEAKAKVSASLVGNKRSLGNVVSLETRIKLSEAAKADWAKRKANRSQGVSA